MDNSTNVKIVSMQTSPSDNALWVAGHFYGSYVTVHYTKTSETVELRHFFVPGVNDSVTLVCPDNQWNSFLIKFVPSGYFPFAYNVSGYSYFGACYHGPGLVWSGGPPTTFQQPGNTTVVSMAFQRQNAKGYASVSGFDAFYPVILTRFDNGNAAPQNVTFITVDLSNDDPETNFKIAFFEFNSGSTSWNYRLSWWPDFRNIGYCSNCSAGSEVGWFPQPLPSTVDSVGMVISADYIYYWGTWTSNSFDIGGSAASPRDASRGSEDTWILQTLPTNPRPYDSGTTAQTQYLYSLGRGSFVRAKSVAALYISSSSTSPFICFEYSSNSVQVGGISSNTFSKQNTGTSNSELGCIALSPSSLQWSAASSVWRYSVSGQNLTMKSASLPPKTFTDVFSTRHIAVTFAQTPSIGVSSAQGFCLAHFNASSVFVGGCAYNGPFVVPNSAKMVFAAAPSTVAWADAPSYNYYVAGSLSGTFSGSTIVPTTGVNYTNIGPTDGFLASFLDLNVNSTHVKAVTFQNLGSDAGPSGPSLSISGLDFNDTAAGEIPAARIFGEYSASSSWSPLPTGPWTTAQTPPNHPFVASPPGISVPVMIQYSFRFTDEINIAPVGPATAPTMVPAPVSPPIAPPIAQPTAPPPPALPPVLPPIPPPVLPPVSPPATSMATPVAPPISSPANLPAPSQAPKLAPPIATCNDPVPLGAFDVFCINGRLIYSMLAETFFAEPSISPFTTVTMLGNVSATNVEIQLPIIVTPTGAVQSGLLEVSGCLTLSGKLTIFVSEAHKLLLQAGTEVDVAKSNQPSCFATYLTAFFDRSGSCDRLLPLTAVKTNADRTTSLVVLFRSSETCQVDNISGSAIAISIAIAVAVVLVVIAIVTFVRLRRQRRAEKEAHLEGVEYHPEQI